jgi:hypothetical protein
METRRILLGVMIVCLAAVAAEAQPVYRYDFRGDPWIDWRYPDGKSVGQDCFSNCGAGCSDSPNPCGGPAQYWLQKMLGDPQFSGDYYYGSCDRYTGTLYIFANHKYVAPMEETYHGFHTWGCQLHDNTCGGIVWLNPGCWWSPLSTCLIDREERDWRWETWREGWRRNDLAEVIENGCPCESEWGCSS